MPNPQAAELAQLSREEIQQRLAGFHRLLEVTRQIALEIDPDKVLSTITHEACIALNCDRASLFQFDAQNQELFTRIATELELDEIRHGIDRGITGFVARTRTIANVPDPASDSRWNSDVDRQTGYQTLNILAAPLVSALDGGLLGVLQLLNKQDGIFDRFDEELLEAFSQHAAAALDRAKLVTELRRRQATEASLNVAREIQQGFMPRALPSTVGYELAAWWYPNEAVGGDYCDVIPISSSRLGLVIADVCGHGLGPSLIMASVRAALRALLLDHSEPQVLMELLARAMAVDLQDGRFVTMVLAQLDTAGHELRYANAGHAPALHYSATEDAFAALEATGFPLGLVDAPEYPPGPALPMRHGDIVLLCTDGIVEAANAQGELFGHERLKAVIRQARQLPAQRLVEQLAQEVEQHISNKNPADDLTILVAKRVG